MSGKFLARASALSLVALLAACGGDDGSTPIVNVNPSPQEPTEDNSGDGTNDNTDGEASNPDTGNGDTGGNTPPEPVYRIGYLTDITDPTTFVANQIQATPPNPLIGNEPARLQVAILKENSDELVLGVDNTVTFFSACASSGWAAFGPESVSLDTGVGYSEYTPDERCAGQDVLYARVNHNFSNLAKITMTNQSPTGSTPPSAYRVGSFDNSSIFQEGILDATTPVLTSGTGGSNSTDLRLAIVDNNDDPVISSGLSVEFTSMCLDAGRAKIETTGVTNSGQLLAIYTAEGPAGKCLGTDSVYALAGTDNQLRASVDLSINENNLAIGSFDSAGTFTQTLAAEKTTLDYNIETEPSTSIRSVIGTLDNSGTFDRIIGKESNVEFFSTCIDSGLSSIDTTGSTASGELISTYKANGCIGDDTVYARITDTDTIASTTLNILPKQGQELALGFFNTGTFNKGVIGNTRSTPLPLGVQTKLYLSIADAQTETQIKGQPLSIKLTSRCGEQQGAISPLSTENASVSLGYIEVLYTAQSCGSRTEDLVRAELEGVAGLTATAETTIALAELPANSLTTGLPTPNSIAPSWYSTEGRETTSTLSVQLKDSQNNGIEGESVTFTLDNPGNTDVAVLEPVNGGKTNEDGYAEVKIKAAVGFDNVVFRVIASYTDTIGSLLEAYSAPIAVNSKLPYAERFSLSTSNFAPDTRGINGVKVPLTLLAADNQGNRIRGNTVVNFETTVGSIEPECILDNEGRCNVTWESLNISNAPGAGYAEIRAYTHGTLAPANANGPTPTGEIDSTVRILMTTSTGVSVELDTQTIPATGGALCAEAFVDLEGTNSSMYSPPVGTTMEFEVTNGTLIPASSSSYTLGSSSALLQTPYSFTGCTFIEPDSNRTELMKLTVTVTPPGGTSAFDRATE